MCYNGQMVSNKGNFSNNITIQLYIAEILSGRSELSALTVTEIQSKLEQTYNIKKCRRTISRNLHGMSDTFNIIDDGRKKSVRYWIETYMEPKIKVGLTPEHLQVIT